VYLRCTVGSAISGRYGLGTVEELMDLKSLDGQTEAEDLGKQLNKLPSHHLPLDAF
jgi:hypothetical protein